MANLGYQSLVIALVLSGYALVIYIAAGRKASAALLASAHRASYAVFFLVTLASAALLYALLSRDFQIQYVAHYTNRSLSWSYTLAAFWAGQDGSLLLWTWLLSIFAVIVIAGNRDRNPELLPVTLAVIQFTTFFFLYLTAFKTNPFVRTPFIPQDGTGLNPLLQNPEMIFHPPSLYVGFVAFTVPFAFAIAALVVRRFDEKWVKSIRRWTLFAWLFLTIGNILGMQWAYVELGWGGYWAWDPVENASLLPWLTGTAFLHSIIVQERKGMLKSWNLSLIVITFALTIFGTFVTRSGLISSVHAFGVSNLGPLFLLFLGTVLIGSFFLIFYRRGLLRGKNQIGSWTSKESSFLVNNILFIALTIGVFIGTIFPTITELIRNEKITVGTDFFNRMAAPIGIAIFFLTGFCALLAWNKTSSRNMLRSLAVPITLVAVGVVLLVLSGVRAFLPVLALAVAIFAISATLLEFIRGAVVRKKTEQLGFFRALLSLALKNKRRYGGYIVHLGVLMFFLGIIGSSAFSLEKDATLKKGQVMELGGYRLIFEKLTTEMQIDRQIDKAIFNVFRGEKYITTLKPEKQLYENFQPATEVAIRSTLKEDLYIILASYDLRTETATVSVLINPLMLWMWIGGGLMVLGTLLSISPQRWRKSYPNVEISHE
ncbi:heme lyase CcmF/NrfE family subunit [candidate division KSB1 bacterium]|nr:heme lyase CcmF/NrfE family subunit [candidate division KSB1 bacterium]